MTTARKYILAAPIILVAIMLLLVACEPDRSGTAATNQPPAIQIVNTPPDGTSFTRNPVINWYGTDIDGFVDIYRYTVIREKHMVIGDRMVSAEEFADSIDAGYQFPEFQNDSLDTDTLDIPPAWEILDVDLDNPQNSATINLFADTEFPVDSLVDQYFFVQAIDNQGAYSDVAYRLYSRSNNYPNTRFRRLNNVFINAKNEQSLANGITVTYRGFDSADYGRTEPPIEYEWRLYGPFDRDASVIVNQVVEDCLYDPIDDEFFNCDTNAVLDINNLPPAIGNVPQPLRQSFNPENGTVWVSDTLQKIYDVFDQLPSITETEQFKFVFWVRARDDGFLPDPTPSFGIFYVIEAKFERDVMVLDATSMRTTVNWGCLSTDTTKTYLHNVINTSLNDIYGGPLPGSENRFDTTALQLVNGQFARKYDYFPGADRKSWGGSTVGWVNKPPRLLDILSHKVLLYFKLDPNAGNLVRWFPNLASDNNLRFSYSVFALQNGASAMAMIRNASGAPDRSLGFTQVFGDTIQYYFGVESHTPENWLAYSIGAVSFPVPCQFQAIWNEEFIGAEAIENSIVPSISIDQDLIDARYVELDSISFLRGACANLTGGVIRPYTPFGLPDVGSCVRGPNSIPLQLYQSRFGSASSLNGRVVSVAKDFGENKSIWCCFTPISIPEDQSIEFFSASLEWLMERWLNPGKSTDGIGLAGNYIPLERRKAAAEGALRQVMIAAEEDPESTILEDLGIAIDPPVPSGKVFHVDELLEDPAVK